MGKEICHSDQIITKEKILQMYLKHTWKKGSPSKIEEWRIKQKLSGNGGFYITISLLHLMWSQKKELPTAYSIFLSVAAEETIVKKRLEHP